MRPDCRTATKYHHIHTIPTRGSDGSCDRCSIQNQVRKLPEESDFDIRLDLTQRKEEKPWAEGVVTMLVRNLDEEQERRSGSDFTGKG